MASRAPLFVGWRGGPPVERALGAPGRQREGGRAPPTALPPLLGPDANAPGPKGAGQGGMLSHGVGPVARCFPARASRSLPRSHQRVRRPRGGEGDWNTARELRRRIYRYRAPHAPAAPALLTAVVIGAVGVGASVAREGGARGLGAQLLPVLLAHALLPLRPGVHFAAGRS